MSNIPTPVTIPAGTITDRMLNRLVGRLHDLFAWVEGRRFTRFPLVFRLNDVAHDDGDDVRRLRIYSPFAIRVTGMTLYVRTVASYSGTGASVSVSGSYTGNAPGVSVEASGVGEFWAWRGQNFIIPANTSVTIQIADLGSAATENLEVAAVTLDCETESTGLADFLPPGIRVGESFAAVNGWWTAFAAACAALLTRRRYWALCTGGDENPATGTNSGHPIACNYETELRLDRCTVDLVGGTSAVPNVQWSSGVWTGSTASPGTLSVDSPSQNISNAGGDDVVAYPTLVGSPSRVVTVLYLSRGI